MKYIVWLAIIIAIIVIGPLAVIWALNSLFPVLNIDYSFANWVAVCILSAAIQSKASIKK